MLGKRNTASANNEAPSKVGTILGVGAVFRSEERRVGKECRL